MLKEKAGPNYVKLKASAGWREQTRGSACCPPALHPSLAGNRVGEGVSAAAWEGEEPRWPAAAHACAGAHTCTPSRTPTQFPFISLHLFPPRAVLSLLLFSLSLNPLPFVVSPLKLYLFGSL